MMKGLEERLAERLARPLPGREAQFRMAGSFRMPADHVYDTSKARIGGVLIALYEDHGAIRTVLMKRPDYTGNHSGQVSFPGGRKEDGDLDVVATALREAQEEVGIAGENVQVIGQLTDLYIPVSNFLVHPVLGILDGIPQLVPDTREVEKVLQPDLNHFFRNDVVGEGRISVQGNFTIKAPYYDVEGHMVWGATAMILSELKQVLAEVGFGKGV